MSSHLDLEPGETVDRFVLIERLGAGGQGEVWKARDGALPGGLVALKLVSLRSRSLGELERVRREARSLAALSHPGLVRCTGLSEDLARGLLVLAMELVDGQPVSALLDDRRFDGRHREAVLRQLARVLAYLHKAGIVHRDIKPENLLISQDFWANPLASGVVRVLDLGIAISVGNPTPLTREFSVIGTPAYLAPEALDPGVWGQSANSSPAVDIFAFGVLGWRLLAGTHPTGLPPGVSSLDYAIAYRGAAQGGARWPVTPLQHPWAGLLGACLSLSPAQRVLSAADLAARLATMDSGGSHVPGLSRGDSPPSTQDTVPVSPSPSAKRPQPSRTNSFVPASTAPVSTPSSPLIERPSVPAPRVRRPPAASRSSGSWPWLIGLGGVAVLGLSLAFLRPHDGSFQQISPSEQFPQSPEATAPTAPTEASCPCSAGNTASACTAGRTAAPFACGSSLPSSGRWGVRLSHVVIRGPSGKLEDLATSSPTATLRMCLAGTATCTTTTLLGARAPDCGRSSRLSASIADLVGRGLDITVQSPSGAVLGRWTGIKYPSIGVRALCDGLIFGKSVLGAGAIEKIGVFLDDP